MKPRLFLVPHRSGFPKLMRLDAKQRPWAFENVAKWHQRCAREKKTIMEGNNEERHTGQQGSGSAENKEQDRQAQQNSNTILNDDERRNLAEQLGETPNSVVGLKDLGALGGRDDAAGGSGDRMERESTGDATDH